MEEDLGFVYALENKSFPGYIKIGQTKNLTNRLAQLNNTGIPDGKPTLLLFAVQLNNYKHAERLLHSALADKRESTSKEFFKATYNQVKTAFDLLTFNDEHAALIRPEEYNSKITGKTYQIITRKIGSRPNRTFKYLSIPAGAKLSFKEDPKIQVTVLDGKNHVLCYCGQKHTLSRAAICCYDFYHRLSAEKQGHDRNGFDWFKYNDILVSAIKPMVNQKLG
ncbi:GIY-YIG nuclease family protein [Liquorilactobacillus satsumensis]|uniref:GIY-YIG nuclease family protein n=1 Tax=Liquorilactobacillus satsumensis TaxID=259059 RepID=UPI0039E8D37B